MAIEAFNIPAKTRRLEDCDFDAWRTSKRLRRESDEEYLAGCLVMLANGGTGASSGSGKYPSSSSAVDLMKQRLTESSDPTAKKNDDRYTCSVCGKGYSSYQALGGHKASHRDKSMSSSAVAKQDKKITASISASVGDCSANLGGRLHQCSTCGRNFPTGQALGGHKRKHYEGVINRYGGTKTGVNSAEGGGATSGVTICDSGCGDASQSKGEASPFHRNFDLNLPAPAEPDLTLSLCGF